MKNEQNHNESESPETFRAPTPEERLLELNEIALRCRKFVIHKPLVGGQIKIIPHKNGLSQETGGRPVSESPTVDINGNKTPLSKKLPGSPWSNCKHVKPNGLTKGPGRHK